MRVAKFLLVVSIAVSLSVASARADCGISSLCPWGCCAAKTAPAGSVTTVANTRGTNTPTVFTKVGSGTKRFVTNTKNLLSLKKPAADKRGGKATYSLRSEPQKPGFFYRLFHPEPPPPPRTIEEWMSLEQIHP